MEQAILANVRALNTGPVDQRLRYVVVVGELEGPDQALDALDKLQQLIEAKDAKLSREQATALFTLRQLYGDYKRWKYGAPAVTEVQKEELRKELDWFGELALAPGGKPHLRDQVAAVVGMAAAASLDVDCPDPQARANVLWPARRAAATVLVAGGTALFALLVGICGLGVLVILWILGKLRGGLSCGTSPIGVYAETFALWLLYFAGMKSVLLVLPAGNARELIGEVLLIISLGVIGWPVLRGVSWRQVCEDLGINFGRRPAAEPAVGVGCYVMGYPLLLAGIIVMLVFVLIQQSLQSGGAGDEFSYPPTPSHPIVEKLVRRDWVVRLMVFIMASIVAPLVEETVFRGVLYRHLRELSWRAGVVVSVIFAAVVSSFIFAVIHPQGIVATPALMALAIVFCLTREWRGSLIPSMTAHGLHNGLVLLLNIFMMGD
jgi:membrane protease YdiL (CAAX protease family)